MALQNIIFDLGGVIINLDYNRTADAFKQLGISDFDDIYSKAKQSNLFDDFEKGNIDNEEFRLRIKAHLPDFITSEQVDQAWNAMLLDIPLSRLEWLQKLSKQYRIFLLSNTNRIHVKAFTEMNEKAFGKDVFENTFEQRYYSCLMGMRKPDAEIFEKVIFDNNLRIDKTLFIDDSIQHINGAKKIGLNAELLAVEKGEKVEEKYSLLL